MCIQWHNQIHPYKKLSQEVIRDVHTVHMTLQHTKTPNPQPNPPTLEASGQDGRN